MPSRGELDFFYNDWSEKSELASSESINEPWLLTKQRHLTCLGAQKGYKNPVPRKIRELLKDLRKAGFSLVPGGKGSHRKFTHPKVMVPAIVPGKDGDDAKPYLEKHVAEKIDESRS